MNIEHEIIDIDDKISKLSDARQEEFRNLLKEFFYSPEWCKTHGVVYAEFDTEPNITRAKEEVYRFFFTSTDA